MLEESFILALGSIVDVSTLKEHGVDMFCTPTMDAGICASLEAKGIAKVVYVVHGRVDSVYDAGNHAMMISREARKTQMRFYVISISRELRMVRSVFEEKNLLGDTVCMEIPYSWVPAGVDVVSLELHGLVRDVMVEKNISALYDVAIGLYQYQSMCGSAACIQAKGAWSCRITDMLQRMRKEAGTNVPAISDHGLDEIILIDRTVDMVTPMCTQLTYEGLLDEVLGIEFGQIRNQGAKKVSGLDDTDPIFRETRDALYSGAQIWIHKTLKEIQKFRDVDMADADVASLKGFVSNLREKFSRMPLHTSLLEKLGNAMKEPSFIARQKLEAEILDDDLNMNGLYDRIYKGDDVYSVLRLMCLFCAVHGGIPKKDFDILRKDVFNTYGFAHIATIHALQEGGILYKKEDRKPSAFSDARTPMGLLVQDGRMIDQENPDDIHYAYAGYAPLSSRLVQQACTKGWETNTNASHYPTKVVGQGLDDDGYAHDTILPRARTTKKGTKNTLVVFVGGVTHAELSTLRFLSKKEMIPCHVTIGTTSILNGTTFIQSLLGT